MRSAEKALQLARRKTQYTRLTAPVDGAIAEKRVSANENVQAGQTILRLNSGSQPEVQVTIPEVLIAQIEAGDDVDVRFDALPGRTFAAKVREVGVTATGGATFPVTVRLNERQEAIRPGMAAEVAFVFAASGDRPRLPRRSAKISTASSPSWPCPPKMASPRPSGWRWSPAL